MAKKHWLTTVVLVGAVCLHLSTGIAKTQSEPMQKPKFPAILSKPLNPAPGDDDIRKLQITRYNTLLAYTAKLYRSGADTAYFIPFSRRLIRVGLELHRSPKEKIEFLAPWVRIAQALHAKVAMRPIQQQQAEPEWREYALEIEIELLRAKKAAKSQK
ncbi:MAG: hypothetical protein HYX68_19945 [Planctomycetes bacterium]|jgi:hypothetical protein|nr:hypothetical protein [Planctomycetota bacterium]